MEYHTTYCPAEAEAAEAKMNARRARLGLPPSRIRSFQKSGNDGRLDRFTITLLNGEPVDIIRDFSPSF